jgi:hypothetical protein
MTSPEEEPPPTSAKRPIASRAQKAPPSGKVVVPVALLVCGGLAFALFASFPSRPRPVVVQPVDSASSLGAPASSQQDAAVVPAPRP